MKVEAERVGMGLTKVFICWKTILFDLCKLYIYNTLVFIKDDISEICISFVFFCETKEKTKDIYIFPIRQPF